MFKKKGIGEGMVILMNMTEPAVYFSTEVYGFLQCKGEGSLSSVIFHSQKSGS